MRVQEYTHDLAIEKGCNLTCCTCGGFPDCICEGDPPTQEFLQKWLREECKVRVFVKNSASGEFTYEIYIVNPIVEERIGRPWERKYYYKSFATYEEALEKGLIESLKLVE